MSKTFDFQQGEVLMIDKPREWTSFDVVNKVRFMLKHKAGIPKIKVGHAGTLDPLATGLLIICTGKMTKKIAEMQLLDKEYTGTITLGATTPSYDAETGVDQTFPLHDITIEKIQKAASELTGNIMQVPPVFSAKKVDGKRAYKYARANKPLTLEPKEVKVFAFDLVKINLPVVEFRVHCSKGTYIRSLAHDLGRLLNNGAYLSSLVRTRIGNYSLEDAINLEQFEFLISSSGQE